MGNKLGHCCPVSPVPHIKLVTEMSGFTQTTAWLNTFLFKFADTIISYVETLCVFLAILCGIMALFLFQ